LIVSIRSGSFARSMLRRTSIFLPCEVKNTTKKTHTGPCLRHHHKEPPGNARIRRPAAGPRKILENHGYSRELFETRLRFA
jgi:hypothetical protein